jgi:hypothetical protein
VVTAALSADVHARAVELGADAGVAKHAGVAGEVVAAARRILEPPAASEDGRQIGRPGSQRSVLSAPRLRLGQGAGAPERVDLV